MNSCRIYQSCLLQKRKLDLQTLGQTARQTRRVICRVKRDDKEMSQEDFLEKKEKVHGLKGRKKSVVQRLRMSQAHTGKKHSAETKEKIRQSMLRFRQQQAPEPDLYGNIKSSIEKEQPARKRAMDYFVMEKALLELSQLRRELSVWLDAWYARSDRKPSLDEVAQLSPEVHNKFLRYIALQEFIRSNS